MNQKYKRQNLKNSLKKDFLKKVLKLKIMMNI